MAIKRTDSENLDSLVKFSQIDLILKLVLLVGSGIGGYIGYQAITQKAEEFQKTIEGYKKKLASIPFIGKSFKEG